MIIGIDMGHGLNGYPNSGANGHISESTETRNLGKKVIDLFIKEGHKIVNCTVDKPISNTDSINKRVAKANAQSLDILISIHFNSGGGTGCEILTYNGKYLAEADRVLKNLSSVKYGNHTLRNRGIKNGTSPRRLAMVNSTKAKSMLIEVCFVDNKNDCDLYKNNLDNIAAAIVGGVLNKTINTAPTIKDPVILENKDHIPSTVLIANSNSVIKDSMIEEIKILQGLVKLQQDGIAREELVKKLPDLAPSSSRGCVTIMQRILILKGFLSSGSATGIIGPACINAINRFKKENGIPENIFFNSVCWRKLLEY